ncbi:uncharacterized protein SPPG_04964 [Spizellomyces punctatus DAOM BR117]|uniref:Uncharacterized protein n=1 Tax=Spizellomyces punctatus (strain DAOM BR117) TaxID=645134 RepID=A0A0L0HDQ0_SPIPD|nr:uncharacterized protein SPPG_04964 [Spizellomyces punctatus DAOM BR117]KNC99575.1 hypothetical protein SPPG_04964 [Spizellomyces punctatus DAOM BR117]|eukprot:XP_016607615.1 hypothetical protein SPPG_04964 [Spizellomyces punctatus DAOM BR117]
MDCRDLSCFGQPPAKWKFHDFLAAVKDEYGPETYFSNDIDVWRNRYLDTINDLGTSYMNEFARADTPECKTRWKCLLQESRRAGSVKRDDLDLAARIFKTEKDAYEQSKLVQPVIRSMYESVKTQSEDYTKTLTRLRKRKATECLDAEPSPSLDTVPPPIVDTLDLDTAARLEDIKELEATLVTLGKESKEHAIVQRIKHLHTMPGKHKPAYFSTLYWGVLDTSDAESVSLLSDTSRQRIEDMCNNVIKSTEGTLSGSATSLLEALPVQEMSIRSLSQICEEFGLSGLFASLGVQDGKVDDNDAKYISRAIQEAAHFLEKYAPVSGLNERSLDAHTMIKLADVPGAWLLLYGEVMSRADQYEKHGRGHCRDKKGKFVDYLYRISGVEIGCGENSGPLEEHQEHALENIVDLAKTARAQLMKLNEMANNEDMIVPFFHVVNRTVHFYLSFEWSPGLFAMHQWMEAGLPIGDIDVTAVVDLAYAFLTFRNIMIRTAKMLNGRPRSLLGQVNLNRTRSLNLIRGVVTPKKRASNNG